MKARNGGNAAGGSATRRRMPRLAWAMGAVVLALSLATAGYAYALVYFATDYSWFDGSGSYKLHTAGQLQALSNLVDGSWVSDKVALGTTGDDSKANYALPEAGKQALDGNGAHSFVGETVALTGIPDFLGLGTVKPIGDAGHAFDGTFDGGGHDVGNLTITNVSEKASDKVSGVQYVGLFGHVGPHGSVKNLELGRGCAIEVHASNTNDHVAYVGSVVGYCEGSIADVESRATVTVSWDDGNGGDGRCASGDYSNAYVIDGVGGIAGYCDGDISGSSYKGALSVRTPADATWVEENQANSANVARYIGGVVGRSGGDPASAGVASSTYGTIRGCTNSAKVSVATTGAGGTDRFGETVDSKSLYVGGVAGYAIGDIEDCVNSGAIEATSHAWSDDVSYDDNRKAQYASDGGADAIGGIVGGFRSATSSGMVNTTPEAISAAKAPFTVEGIAVDRGIAGKQDGGADVVQITGCTNLGSVLGCNNVGGIAGATGTYTRLVDCANGDAARYLRGYDEVGRVVSVRWNKPMTGGLVGRCMGDVCYSRNHGEVTTTKGGYYVGGLVGDLYFYRDSLNKKFVTPEVYACYSTGQVGTSVTFRRGALLGGSGGYIHDCLYLFGTSTASEDESVAAIGQEKAEDEPMKARLSVAYASDSQAAQHGTGAFSMKSASAVAWLNSSAMRTDPVDGKAGWDIPRYYMATPSLNVGYPVLYSADALASSAVDLAKLSPDIELVEDATYTSAYNPTPKLRVTVEVDGEQRELVENADYYVIADPNAFENGACKGATDGQRIYTAQVRGIGAYASEPVGEVKYAIGKGDFSECTVSVPTKSFTNEGQTLSAAEVTVLDPAGNQVEPGSYTVRVNDGKECKEPGSYKIVASAATSGNYVGDVAGTFAISKIDIARDCDVIGITYDERTNGGVKDVEAGTPEVWFYDDETYKLYQVEPIFDKEGKIATYGENDLDELKTGAKDAEGTALEVSEQPDYEVLRGYIGYPKVEGFQVYRDEDGRWLTRADKKEGSPSEPSFTYTAAEIRPDVIGVNWNRGKLSFAKDGDTDIPAWRAIYGGGAGGSTSSVGSSADSGSLNIEAAATGAITVVTNDKYSTYVRNYDVMTFDIAPAAITSAEESWLGVTMNSQFRTFKQGDVLTPQVVVTYKGNVVNSSNYVLSISRVTDSENQEVKRRSGFIEGDTVYYQVAFKKNGSVHYDGELTADSRTKDELSCTVVNDRLPLNAATVSVEFTGTGWNKLNGVWEKAYSLEEGIDYPTVKVTSITTGNELVEDTDYKVSYAVIDSRYPGYRYASAHEYVGASAYSPVVTITGLNEYMGNYGIYYRVKKGTLAQEQLSSIASGGYDKARFVNTLNRTGHKLSELGNFFAYRESGYDKDDFADLGIVFTGTSLSDVDSHLFEVSRIMDSTGKDVALATAPGKYFLEVSADTQSGTYRKYTRSFNKFFDVDEGVTVQVPIEVVPVNLSGPYHVVDGFPYYAYMMNRGTVFLRVDLSDKDKETAWWPTFDEYSYTGRPIKPRYLISDSRDATHTRLSVGDAGATHLESDEEVCKRLMSHSFAHDTYNVLVEGYVEQGGPTEVGRGYQVIGLRPASGSNVLEGELDISEGNLPKNTFSIVPADISNGAIVGIRVGEGADGKSGAQVGENRGYLGTNGARPKVHFFVDADGIDGDDDGTLFDADEECAYVEGSDYEVEYLNNADVSPAGTKTATARIWVKDTRHLCAPDGTWDALRGCWYFDVPFAVEGRQVTLNDQTDVTWDVSKQLVVGQDGQLSTPYARATYKQATGAGEENVVVPARAYELKVGTETSDGFVEGAPEGGWTMGSTVSIAVEAGKMNRFKVDDSKTAVIATAEIVSKADGNDFAATSFPYSISLAQSSYTYGAVAREPKVNVASTGDSQALVEGRDYSVEYRNNMNAGTATAVVRGIGAFTGEHELAFAINKLDLSQCAVTGADKRYAGGAVTLVPEEVTVTCDDVAIPATAGWELSSDGYTNNVNVGSAGFAIKAVDDGNLTGQTSGTFRVVGRPLADDACEVANPQPQVEFADGATAVTMDQFGADSIKITDKDAGGRSLVLGEDFEIAGIANANGYANANGSTGGVEYVGYATLTLTGKGNYSGAITVNMPIAPKSLASANLAFSGDYTTPYAVTYTGQEQRPQVTVALGGLMLQEGTDYALRYSNNVNAGTAEVTAVGRGIYAGSSASQALAFEIKAAEGAGTYALAAQEVPYSGMDATPAGTLTIRDEKVAAKNIDLSYARLEGPGGADAEAVAVPLGEGEKPVEPGHYRVTATATGGNVRGSASADFSIVPADLAGCTLKLGEGIAIWPGNVRVEPDVTVVTAAGVEVPLTESGCTAQYESDSWQPGALATVTVSSGASGKFTGEATATYEISRIPIKRADVTPDDMVEFKVTGEDVMPDVAITVDGRTLIVGKDYTVEPLTPDLKSAGIKVLEIKTPSDGFYSSNGIQVEFVVKDENSQGNASGGGSASGGGGAAPSGSGGGSAPPVVAPKDISEARIAVEGGPFVYDATQHKPTVSVGIGQDRLSEGVDYTAEFADNVNAGTAKVTVTGIGAYTGIAHATFEIARRQATVTPLDATKEEGAVDPELEATEDGIVEGEAIAYKLEREPGESVGEYAIVATGAAEQGNYAVSFGEATFTIVAKPAEQVTDVSDAPSAADKTSEGGSGQQATNGTDGTSGSSHGAKTVASAGGASCEIRVTAAGTAVLNGCNANTGSAITVNVVKVGGKSYKVSSIAANAFAGTKAASVIVGKNVKTIGAKAFSNASKLKKVVIGKNVKSIGKNAFKGSKNLKTITISSAKLTKKGVKAALKGSSVKTVKLTGAAKKKLKAYKAYFKKSNCGKSVTVKR